jgi:hypothetical protein
MPSIRKKKTTGCTPLQPRTASQHSSEEPTDTSQTSATGDTPKPPTTFMSDVITIPPLLQLLDQTAFQLYEIKALANNKVKIKPKTPNT